jgi:hypothetical protein
MVKIIIVCSWLFVLIGACSSLKEPPEYELRRAVLVRYQLIQREGHADAWWGIVQDEDRNEVWVHVMDTGFWKKGQFRLFPFKN